MNCNAVKIIPIQATISAEFLGFQVAGVIPSAESSFIISGRDVGKRICLSKISMKRRTFSASIRSRIVALYKEYTPSGIRPKPPHFGHGLTVLPLAKTRVFEFFGTPIRQSVKKIVPQKWFAQITGKGMPAILLNSFANVRARSRARMRRF